MVRGMSPCQAGSISNRNRSTKPSLKIQFSADPSPAFSSIDRVAAGRFGTRSALIVTMSISGCSHELPEQRQFDLAGTAGHAPEMHEGRPARHGRAEATASSRARTASAPPRSGAARAQEGRQEYRSSKRRFMVHLRSAESDIRRPWSSRTDRSAAVADQQRMIGSIRRRGDRFGVDQLSPSSCEIIRLTAVFSPSNSFQTIGCHARPRSQKDATGSGPAGRSASGSEKVPPSSASAHRTGPCAPCRWCTRPHDRCPPRNREARSLMRTGGDLPVVVADAMDLARRRRIGEGHDRMVAHAAFKDVPEHDDRRPGPANARPSRQHSQVLSFTIRARYRSRRHPSTTQRTARRLHISARLLGRHAVALVEPGREHRSVGIERQRLEALALVARRDRLRLGKALSAVGRAGVEHLAVEGLVPEDRERQRDAALCGRRRSWGAHPVPNRGRAFPWSPEPATKSFGRHPSNSRPIPARPPSRPATAFRPDRRPA